MTSSQGKTKRAQSAGFKNPAPQGRASKTDTGPAQDNSNQAKSSLIPSSPTLLVGDLRGGIGTARQFLREVAVEFNKITWPGRSQVIQETYSVLFLVAVITLIVLAFDWGLSKFIFGPLEYWARLHGGGVGRG